MGMELPKALTEWLDKDWRRPVQNFVDCSLYYAGLNVYFIDYMRNVVRPCVAYASGTADAAINSGVKLNVGKTIKDTAVKLIKGDRILFEGDDTVTKAIADIWAPSVHFESFLEAAIDDMMTGGTVAVKLNKDAFGRVFPSELRVDRYYADTDEIGNIYRITMFNSFLFSESYGRGCTRQYWLVEQRYYNAERIPCVVYKVHLKSGIAGKELMPTMSTDGISEEGLPQEALNALQTRGIVLNTELQLPFRDGLGVWLWRRTANNSCVPGLPMGDPLLYGALDIIWAVDVVFSGSITDVILGKGKILVPKKYLQSISQQLQAQGLKVWNEPFTDRYSDSDDSLVYIYTEHDKDFTPQSVQFQIRSESYRGMLEIYLRQLVAICGFAPTSIFPFLADESAKTATEVTAEENLTRATVQSMHQTIVPEINRLLREVCCQYGFETAATIKLSDYIGNKILRDQNIRDNFNAGLMPLEIAVQRINDISAGETQEYIDKIKSENGNRMKSGLFNESDYYSDDTGNTSGDNGEQ